MTNLSREQFEKALRYLGRGDPASACLWFLGIDDGCGFRAPDDLAYLCSEPNSHASATLSHSQENAIIARLVVSLMKPERPLPWKAYRDNKLFTKGSEAFLTYIFPIGRNTWEKWPSIYEEKFGMTSARYHTFALLERPGRLGYLHEVMQRGNCRLLIFYGMSKSTRNYWKSIMDFFDLKEDVFLSIGDYIRAYPVKRIVMLPPFTNTSMKQATIHRIVRLIDEIGLNPFKEGEMISLQRAVQAEY